MRFRWQTLALGAVLAASVGALAWVVVPHGSAREAVTVAVADDEPTPTIAIDPGDPRPIENVLFLGNSHTFVNDVPSTVARVVDSMHATRRIVVAGRLVGGQSLKGHWNDPVVQRALAKRWDVVIVQPQGIEASFAAKPADGAEFLDYGGRLLDAARARSARVALYEVFRPSARSYGVDWWLNDDEGALVPLDASGRARARDDIFATKERLYAELAREHRADVADVCRAWRASEAHCPQIELYGGDAHHASPRGSYLAALVIARYLEGGRALAADTFAPATVTKDDAACLRGVANLD